MVRRNASAGGSKPRWGTSPPTVGPREFRAAFESSRFTIARHSPGEMPGSGGRPFGSAKRTGNRTRIPADGARRVGARVLHPVAPVRLRRSGSPEARRQHGGKDAGGRPPQGTGVRAIGVERVPMPEISMCTVCPGRRNSGGSRAEPTPSGVPVAITSPGWRVMIELA